MTWNLALVGFMGTGKSTVGALLARRLGWTFVDTDQEVEVQAELSVAEIFEREGEAGFRRREGEFLKSLEGSREQVIATGGGAVIDPANRQSLRRHALLCGLRARPSTVLQRIQGGQRPLLQGADPLQRIQALLQARAEAYADADLHLDTDDRPPHEVVDLLLSALPAAKESRGGRTC